MKQCDFQNNYGTVAQRKVSSCAPIYSSFSIDPMDFFLGANLYQKLLFFCEFGGFKATFLKP